MRRALAFVLLPAALAAQAPAPAPSAQASSGDAETLAKRGDIRKLLNAMHAGEVGAKAMEDMVQTMRETNKSLPAEFWDAFLKEATPEKLMEIMIPVYEKNLTHAEVKAYLAFAATPEGASIMAKIPALQAESMAAGQAWGQRMGMEIAQRLQAEGKM